MSEINERSGGDMGTFTEISAVSFSQAPTLKIGNLKNISREQKKRGVFWGRNWEVKSGILFPIGSVQVLHNSL